jgi:hypothetical protein
VKLSTYVVVAVPLVILGLAYYSMSNWMLPLPGDGFLIFLAIGAIWAKGSSGVRWALFYYVMAYFLLSLGQPRGGIAAAVRRGEGQLNWVEVMWVLGVLFFLMGTVQSLRVLFAAVTSRRPLQPGIQPGPHDRAT